MNDIGNIIKKRRQELNMTLEDVGDLVGVGKSTVRKWENGMIENMGRDKISLLSKALDISPLLILGINDDKEIYNQIGVDYLRIPLYSPICCGDGGFNDDNVVEEVTIPSKGLQSSYNYFAQVASGESMIDAGINDGDLLVFEKAPRVDNGVIGCFCVDDNEAMCKKYKEDNGIIMLQPMNSKYDPISIDLTNGNFRCLGKLRKVIKDFYWEDD